MTLAARVTFAGATTEDFEELLTLRIAAMRESLERLNRFDPGRARQRLRNSFHPADTHFILMDARRVGFYTLRPVGEHLLLDHLYVHPDAQSQGIGSHVLRQVIARADARRLPIKLGALRGSASNRFYQRHGFTQTAEDEFDIYYTRPVSPQP